MTQQNEGRLIHQILSNEELLALSESSQRAGVRGAEWTQTVLPRNRAEVAFGSPGSVNEIARDAALEYVHTQPGLNNLMPSIADLDAALAHRYFAQWRIVARGQTGEAVSVSFNETTTRALLDAMVTAENSSVAAAARAAARSRVYELMYERLVQSNVSLPNMPLAVRRLAPQLRGTH
jgi:hypothetical protein